MTGIHTSSELSNTTREAFDKTTRMLDELVNQVRNSIPQVREPKAQALFETSAEVLIGLKKAYTDYEKGGEDAWK